MHGDVIAEYDIYNRTIGMQGGGIVLGQDCDGMLNNCEKKSAATACAARSAEEFSLESLLGSVQLPRNYPTATAPKALVTKPKTYQLQVDTVPVKSYKQRLGSTLV